MGDTQALRDEDRDVSLGCSHDSEMHKLKYNLRKKFNCLCEGTVKQGSPTPLNEIYTELYITESESGEISKEYEMFETEPRKEATEDTLIKHNDIFRTLPEQDKPIRTVLTRGVAGIGKTVSVQKFILDWAEGKANQEVHLIFPLPFRELNLMKDQKLSLSDLLVFFIETKEIGLSSNRYKILFIFDGLDECRISLDFQSSVRLCDVTKSSSVDVLLINLIKGNLLPSALIWITSRPAAADLIPSECVDRVTEVRGFSGQQKEEYFRKRISDQSLANRIITHLKSSRSLYIMCHIPVFCWISATVLERTMSEAESQEIPKTLTQMYTHFLIIQTNIKREKDYEKTVKDEDMIVKLGKLAFLKFMKGNLMFYEEDLIECGIDVREASVYSGLCTQIFREEFGMIQRKVYCFVHLSIQEHLAAVYVHLCFTNNNINAFDQITKQTNHTRKTLVSIFDLHQRAVDEALESKNGYLDIFLCFLLGLSVESNQTLLQELMTETRSSSHSNEEIVKYIKQKIRENPSPEKSINLFYCLNELGDHSLLRVMEQFLKSEKKNEAILSFSQWSAVVSALLNKMIEKQNDDVCLKPQPYVKARSSVKVSVSSKVHTALKKLRSNFAKQRELNLSGNKLGYPEVQLLSVELTNPDCKLDTLRLRNCGITDKVFAVLTSALRLNPSHLRELYLSDNHLGDGGVMRLSAELGNKHCKMEILWLCNCGVTDKGCSALASALRTNPSHLRELNMSGNNLGDSGVNLLSAELQNPHCNLETLRLCHCGITGEGCAALASALISRPSHLTELNLTGNKLGDSGIMRLSSGLKNPRCKLEILRLCNCDVTDEGCSALASALGSNPSHFKVLDLLGNKLSDTGLQPLVALKKLRSLSF